MYLVMVNWNGSNRGFSLRFCADTCQITYQLKHCDYNNKDKVNSLNILSNDWSNNKRTHCYSNYSSQTSIELGCTLNSLLKKKKTTTHLYIQVDRWGD